MFLVSGRCLTSVAVSEMRAAFSHSLLLARLLVRDESVETLEKKFAVNQFVSLSRTFLINQAIKSATNHISIKSPQSNQ